MTLSRRHFLKTAAATTLGFGGLGSLFARSAFASPRSNAIAEGFGPLLPDPAGIFDLPAGFRYKIISRIGEEMSDGLLVPGDPDGMGAFPGPEGLTILVRNHEISANTPELGGYGLKRERLSTLDASHFYDYGHGEQPGLGGTTTLLYDTRSQELIRQHISLAGTERNCAGGPTPWNSWISCEENVQRAEGLYEKDHGFVFEVPAAAIGPVKPHPIQAMGRFNHEAIAIDPHSGVVYLTEDRPDSLVYRFIPQVPGVLTEGGRLQALAVRGRKMLDTRNWDEHAVSPGDSFPVYWIDLEDILSPNDDLRMQGYLKGAARFARGEGMWYGNDAVYFACTNGGHAQKGQIWRYVPSAVEGQHHENDYPGVLELFVEPNDGGLIDNADNLTVAPWGDLVVCEDGLGEQFLVGVRPDGSIYKIGRNATPGNSELAGATFSPDGTTLFVNIQHEGLTLAITGPWQTMGQG
ncbi:MAG: DUF839 domain-containing protein [Candidatus Hydrogenedentes bacterium]|nr:DUF839 domain-containing protein [Candidatus Hydrogenedentota bacterium]